MSVNDSPDTIDWMGGDHGDDATVRHFQTQRWLLQPVIYRPFTRDGEQLRRSGHQSTRSSDRCAPNGLSRQTFEGFLCAVVSFELALIATTGQRRD